MVRVENGKLIIEVEDHSPVEKLQFWRDAITDAIKNYNYKELGLDPPTFWLMEILVALNPDYTQLKRAMCENATPEQIELIDDAVHRIAFPKYEPDHKNPVFDALTATPKPRKAN